MDISQYARQSRLPLKTLRWMVSQKLIHNPLAGEDLIGLKLLESVWGKYEILRAQLTRFSKKRRAKLIETADLKTKWERYAYSRFSNLAPGQKLAMNKLIEEVEITFDFILKENHIQRLYKVRQKVYNQRKTLVKAANK